MATATWLTLLHSSLRNDELNIVIEDYYKTIYPDEEVREYMWNNDALSLNGERLFQTFNIHTGSGSNSKLNGSTSSKKE